MTASGRNTQNDTLVVPWETLRRIRVEFPPGAGLSKMVCECGLSRVQMGVLSLEDMVIFATTHSHAEARKPECPNPHDHQAIHGLRAELASLRVQRNAVVDRLAKLQAAMGDALDEARH